MRFFKSDLLGLVRNAGDPTGPVSTTQGSNKLYYCLQFSQGIAITSGLQLLTNSANNLTRLKIKNGLPEFGRVFLCDYVNNKSDSPLTCVMLKLSHYHVHLVVSL